MENIPYPSIDSNQPHGWDEKTSNGKYDKDGKQSFGACYIAKYPTGVNVAIAVNTGASTSDLQSRANEINSLVSGAAIPWNYDLFDDDSIGP